MKFFVVSILCLFFGAVNAQIRTPQPSPGAKLTQTIGLATFSVEYSRPGVKGRTIFGGEVVPFGSVWRTGANAPTSLSFDRDIVIEGIPAKAGKYIITSIVNQDNWTVRFVGEKNDTLKVVVPVIKYGIKTETFTIQFANIQNSGADLQFIWDETLVNLNIQLSTDAEVMASIDKFKASPESSLAQTYYDAASYYFANGKDKVQALAWVDKALAIDGNRFWVHRTRALILADLGRYADAIEAAKVSHAKAKEAKNDEYVRMNEKSIGEWTPKAVPTPDPKPKKK
ncbi:MAG: DUF2911 domain-containing protein [Chitinophagaceae bacterium]|nr:DUF2911 domain-containing protein [Chitinophagaceae bacterium]